MALSPPGVSWTTPQHTTSLVCQLLKKTGLSSSDGDSYGESLTGSTPTIAMRLLPGHKCGTKPSLYYKIKRRDVLQEQNGNAVLHSLEVINSHNTPVSNGQKMFGISLTAYCPSRSAWTKLWTGKSCGDSEPVPSEILAVPQSSATASKSYAWTVQGLEKFMQVSKREGKLKKYSVLA